MFDPDAIRECQGSVRPGDLVPKYKTTRTSDVFDDSKSRARGVRCIASCDALSMTTRTATTAAWGKRDPA